MSGCESAVEYMYQFLDEELTWARKARVKWHLKKCENCCGAFDFEGRLKQLVRERGRDEPPPELFDRLRALLHEEGTLSPDE